MVFSTSTIILAQKGVVVGGGDMLNETGSMSFSIGQTDYAFISSSTFSLQFGLQQVIPGVPVFVEKPPNTKDFFNVFPNPTYGPLTIKLSGTMDSENHFAAEIFDPYGRLIKSKNLISGESYSLNLAGQSSGVYILRLRNGDTMEFTKIVKK